MTEPIRTTRPGETARKGAGEEKANKDEQREMVFEKKAVRKGQNATDRGRRRPSELSNVFAQGVALTHEERQLHRMPQPGPRLDQSPRGYSPSSFESTMPEIPAPRARRRLPPIQTETSASLHEQSPPPPNRISQDWDMLSDTSPLADPIPESTMIPRRTSIRLYPRDMTPEDEMVQSKLSSKPVTQRGKRKEDIAYPEGTNFSKPLTPVQRERRDRSGWFSPHSQSKDSSPEDIFPFAQQAGVKQEQEKTEASIVSKRLLETNKRLKSLMFAESDDEKVDNPERRGKGDKDCE